MQLLWPGNLTSSQAGYALGWQSDRVTCVLAIVEDWQSTQAVLATLDNQREHGISGLRIVGIAGNPGGGPRGSSSAISESMRFSISNGRLTGCSPSVQILLVDSPDPSRLRYLTAGTSGCTDRSASARELEVQDQYGVGERKGDEGDGVEEILRMTNSMREAQRQIARAGSPSHGHRAPLLSAALTSLIPIVTLTFVPINALLHLIIRIVESRIPFISPPHSSIASRSRTLDQLALRARQLVLAPATFRKTIHKPGVLVQDRSRRYMGFWNTVWLILNDLILGYCAYQIITHNRFFLSHLIPHRVERHLANDVVSALNWLNDWPVGLKLNTPLSQFFSSTLGSVISQWKKAISPTLHYSSPHLITTLAFASTGGLTLLLAALEDVVSLFTLHLRLCDMITRGICRWQLASLSGLWHLFRGKRWNVLRQRTDSYAYDVDQLFLGTLLFTVSAFLFPTVLTYAGLFYLLSTGIWASQYALGALRKSLNSFPLFELLLRFKEPSRLPAGIHFVLHPKGKGASALPCLELRGYFDHSWRNLR